MKPEAGWYAALVGLLCAAFLAAGSLLFVSMLGTAIGPFRFDAMLRDLTPKPLGLWTPAAARASGDEALRSWRALLPPDLAVLESEKLPELLAAGANPIVVSDARALASDELAALRVWTRGGGTLVLAGWVAVRDERGRPRGNAWMAKLLGVAQVATIRSAWLARGRRGPLASGIDGRLELPEPSAVPGAAEPGELYWSDAQGAPAAAACGALRLVPLGSGSVLWIAALPAAPDLAWRTLYASAFAAALGRPAHELRESPVDASLRGPELEAWRRARAALHTEFEAITPRRLRLRVINAGSESAQSIAVRIYLNRTVVRAAARSSTLFTSAPQLRRGVQNVDLELPTLPAGASRTYIVDVEP